MVKLTAAKYRFKIKVKESMILPPYKGSTFRGGFGGVFRKIACSQRQCSECGPCIIKNNCPYRFIFEPGSPEQSELWNKFDEIPRPFILEPPDTRQTLFKPGETINFDLVLIGKAITYIPYFILVFKELGEVGIGKRRAKFELISIDTVDPQGKSDAVVFDGERVYSVENDIRDLQLQDLKDRQRLTIHFQTMTRLKVAGELSPNPEFTVLMRALLRRLSALQYFYTGVKLECDFHGLVDQANQVKLVHDETVWVDWERYSSRQDTRMKMGGLVGKAVYEGPWQTLAEFLAWGEILHVGKGATFGLGKYEIL
ncbi:MAG: CRISPR system precrRNA processing endoribonuclease RAMP protein Cas6 [Bacteroidota bacterium]